MNVNTNRGVPIKPLPLERTAQVLLCLLVLSQYFEHLRFMPITVSKLLGIVLAIVVVLSKRLIKRPDPVFWHLVLFLVVFIFSSIYYLYEIPVSFQREVFTKILTLVQLVALYYFAFCLFTREQTQRYFISMIFLGGAIVAYLGILNIGMTTSVGRMGFSGADENVMASLIGLSLLSSIYLLINSRRLLGRLSISICIIVMAWYLVGTGSRGGMLAFGAGAIAFLIRSQNIRYKYYVGLVLIVFLWTISQSQVARERWRLTVDMGDTAGRDKIIAYSWEQFKERPILGRGDFNAYLDLGTKRGTFSWGFHNELFWVLNSTGVVGGIIVLLIIGRVVISITRKEQPKWRYNISLGYLTMLGFIGMTIEFHDRKILWMLLAFLLSGTMSYFQYTVYRPKKYVTDVRKYR